MDNNQKYRIDGPQANFTFCDSRTAQVTVVDSAKESDRNVFSFVNPEGRLAAQLNRIQHGLFQLRFPTSSTEFLGTYHYRMHGCLLFDAESIVNQANNLLPALAARWFSLPMIVVVEPQNVLKVIELTDVANFNIHVLTEDPSVLANQLEAAFRRDQIGEVSPRNVRRGLANLGAQERRVLDMTIDGLTSKAIASRMKLRYQTIDKYRRMIWRKMDVSNAVELLHRIYGAASLDVRRVRELSQKHAAANPVQEAAYTNFRRIPSPAYATHSGAASSYTAPMSVTQ